MTREANFRVIPFRLISVFLVLSVGISLVGYFFYQKEKARSRIVGEESLSAIADLKVKQIRDWQDERVRDAGFIFNNVRVADRVAELRSNPSDAAARESILAWMTAMYKNRQYSAMWLVDPEGGVLLSLPREAAVRAYRQAALHKALRLKKVLSSDFFTGEDRNVYIDFIVPILLGKDRKEESIGAVILRIDPHGFLYQIVQSWPTPSSTAESLLVRREGEEIVFLNELRHKKNTALSLRFPVNQKNLPAAMAVQGRTGVVEGTDYRGVPVLAALRPIPDSPWFLVAKVDIEEIYAPNRVLFGLIGLLTGLLIVSSGLSVMLFWRHQHAKSEASLRESEEQFRAMFETASIGIAQADIRTGRWLRVNQKMCEITGYSSEEMLRMRIPEITHPEDRERDWEAFQSVVNGEAHDYHLEKRYVRKDGKAVWVNVNMTVIRDAGGEPLRTMATIEDITERKQSELEREATVEFLQLVNRNLVFDDLVKEAASYFQRRSGCEAVGIRLNKGGDYPYHEARGFPPDFVRTENSLCSKDAAGSTVCDDWGSPVLACMCGNIICGRFDPSKPFFSPGGSFWSNSTTELLASTTDADRKARTRNRCNGEGYESVALVPLRVGEERLGLIQLNDRRKDMFSPELIALWERLAGYLAVALAKVGAEDALKESEAHYRSLFENMLNGFAYCRMIYKEGSPWDFIYLDVNPAFERLTGLKDVVGKRVSEVIPGIREADPGLFEVYGRVCQSGVPETIEIYVEALAMWFSISVYSTKKEYFVAVFDVITERKMAEEALLRSEEKYRTLVENVNIGIYRRIAGHRGRFLQVNDAMAFIFGYPSAEEFLNVSPYEIYEKMEDWESFEEKILDQGYIKGEKIRLRRKDGSAVWCSVTAKIHRDEESGIEYIDGVMEDVTERRNLEAQLVQAQKMEAVGQLAGGVAHDFNNILTAMMGYSHILKVKLKEDDSLRTYADRILSLADRASSLTQSLLAFSRKQVMNPKPANLNEIIKTVERLLFRIIGEDIHLQTLLSDKELTVLADHVQLEQVLMNLATNARDAMPQGGFLTIETEALNIDREFIKEHGFGKEGEYALVSVTDSGLGMEREIREKIFEPFFTTKGVGKGTGLGLSMAYGIVRQHDGHINVYSEPGKGTTFRIYLPLIHAKVEEIKPEVLTPIETGTETILLAEDEAEVRIFTKRLLEEYGYKVIEATNGEDALDKFRAYKDEIGMLLLDVIMPGMSGGEAYEEMRKIKPDIKVLFLSGYPGDAIRKQGMLDEGFNLVMKPVSPSVLLKRIRDVLEG